MNAECVFRSKKNVSFEESFRFCVIDDIIYQNTKKWNRDRVKHAGLKDNYLISLYAPMYQCLFYVYTMMGEGEGMNRSLTTAQLRCYTLKDIEEGRERKKDECV